VAECHSACSFSHVTFGFGMGPKLRAVSRTLWNHPSSTFCCCFGLRLFLSSLGSFAAECCSLKVIIICEGSGTIYCSLHSSRRVSVACFYASLACQFTHFIIDSENFQCGEAFEIASSFEVAGLALVFSARSKEHLLYIYTEREARRERERDRERQREQKLI